MRSLAEQFLPKLNKVDIKVVIRIVQNFLWGRAVYTFLGIILSVFIVFGGILGSILLFEQNKLITKQNEKIASQNGLLSDQTHLLKSQNTLFSLQNEFIKKQTKLLQEEDLKLGVQNESIKIQ